MTRLGCRSPLSSFGIWMLGPALLKFGTEEQKVKYLNEIARGEIRWCQGYSEPGSGSDLVSLQTYGDDQGDHWIVNGQKVWTSYADKADWIFCLVRTDKADKYRGISFLLFDMESDGVSTKPILLISGNSPFCETFFSTMLKSPRTRSSAMSDAGGMSPNICSDMSANMISGGGRSGDGAPSLGAQVTGALGLNALGMLDDPILRR